MPDLRHERSLLRGGARLVAGMDEVGRGALAGPVSVGVVVVDERTRSCPRGLTDSKLLTPRAREGFVAPTRRWCVASAVGHASSWEIDAVGIVAALRLAGRRALAAVADRCGPVDVVLLDGSHDWLSRPQEDLFAGLAAPVPGGGGGAADEALVGDPAVVTLVKADLRCASVAGASVLAKCERDAMLVGLAHEHAAYAWESNKGYASAEHADALRRHGPSPLHRTSWRLPGLVPGTEPGAPVAAVGTPIGVHEE
ncbi:ribonuclease HII [Cellulomonas sp. PhB143]|uniref:ribonuclease HII n=1 Tax=Cellulomonas sp. PhB143 TaxID=2485186 RepID=UPI000F4AE379|nr:ribonuclease HII [Cellulomonas sp. PhB143]ROS77119.1 RNase HII [Cellulomonas sp. PhB143]